MDYFQMGNDYYMTKDFENALSMYLKCIDDKSAYPVATALYNAAVCCIRLSNYDTAMKYLKDAIDIKPTSKFFYNLAYCYAMKEDKKKALVYFNLSWALSHDDEDCEKAIKIMTKNLCK